MATQTNTNTNQLPSWLQSNLDQYKMQQATAQDLAKLYGFEYSPEDANRMAEAEAQAKRAGLTQQQQQLDNNLKSFQQGLDQQYFLNYMNQAQNQVNNGLNAGIAADQNVRLAMNKQNAMADYMRNDQAQRNNIMQQLYDLENQKMLRAQNLYQERLQQMFENSLALNASRRADLQLLMQQDQFNRNLQMDWYKFNNLSADQQMSYRMAERQLQEQIRQFNSEMEWKKYTYNNMSAAERAQLDWEIEKFGEDLAWERQKQRMVMQQAILGSDLSPENKDKWMSTFDSANFLE